MDHGKAKKIKKKYTANTLLLIGGFTRTAAAMEAGLSEAPAIVHEGTWQDALLLAWHENSTHGRPRDHDEVWAVLDSIHNHPDYRTCSEKEMAQMSGTSRSTVNRYRTDRRHRVERASQNMNGASPSLMATVKSLVDSWGRDVPETLVEDFRVVPQAKKITQTLRELAAKVISLKYGSDLGTQCQEPGLERFDVRELGSLLMEWADRGEASLPFLVCPAPTGCDGEGVVPDPKSPKKSVRCEQCIGRGYMLLSEIERLPPEAERTARAAA